MAPVRVVGAFKVSMIIVATALALGGCMRRSGPVVMVQPQNTLDTIAYGGRVPPMATAYAAPNGPEPAYRLDAGDRLRVVVYGQEGLTNTYSIDAAGAITMPLIGSVPARGRTPAGLAAEITSRLRRGFIREPSVAVEVESYRPFFILGEVTAPGQYPYVPHMSVESAVAIAGGFTPRAQRDHVTVTHPEGGATVREVVPLGTPLSPGDTVYVGERWF